MSIGTALTAKLGLEHPIVSAPMGGVAGGVFRAAQNSSRPNRHSASGSGRFGREVSADQTTSSLI